MAHRVWGKAEGGKRESGSGHGNIEHRTPNAEHRMGKWCGGAKTQRKNHGFTWMDTDKTPESFGKGGVFIARGASTRLISSPGIHRCLGWRGALTSLLNETSARF